MDDESDIKGDGDDLIVGFGARHSPTEESGDGRDLYDHDNTRKYSDNTLICGFGGDAGSSSSHGSGIKFPQEAMQEGLMPTGSNGNDSQLQNGDHQKFLSDIITNLIEQPLDDAVETPLPEQIEPIKENIFSISTKISDGSSVRRPARRRNSRGLDQSGSSTTSCDLSYVSMASEDAVVLMHDLLSDSEREGQNQVHKSGSHTEVCGRVYRHLPNFDYKDLPTELEIEGHRMHHSNKKESPPSQTAVNVYSDREENNDSEGPPRNISVEHDFTIPASVSNGTSASFPKSFNDTKSKEASNMQSQSHEKSQPSSGITQLPQDVITMQKPPGEFPRPKKVETKIPGSEGLEEEYGQIFITSESRGSTNLDIIEEGSKDSESMARMRDSQSIRDSQSEIDLAKTLFASKVSMTSTRETSTDFEDDDTFHADIDHEIDMPKAVASRKNALIGQHAKSMAKEFKKESYVRTLSERLDQDQEKDEGRVAILSRQDTTDYVKKVVHKTEKVKQLIRESIISNILLKACSDEELDDLVDVFDYTEASAGSIIIRQGDDGDAFYVMEEGIVDVAEEGIHKTALSGSISFGEIALLYGCPRSATLRARRFCKLWYIGRTAFRAITSQHKRKRLETKIESLKKVQIKGKSFSDVLSESEIDTLALAAITESYKSGDVIVKEGDPGDIFYMIDSGSVDVFIEANGEEPVANLTAGQFFGEMALLSNAPRAATCIAKTDVRCQLLMRHDFILLLGDLESLMKTNYKTRLSNHEEDSTDSKLIQPKLEIGIQDMDIIKTLGVGAFGRVQLAKLKRPIKGLKPDSHFALKCISKQNLKESGLEVHMSNEQNIMSSLDHPFINKFYCEMEDEKYLYFLLEALTGGELCKRLREEKRFPESWSRFYSASVLFALCHMHSMKIAYRDLKPENLVMDSVGYVKVVDFGLAKVIEGGKTWTLCGTPAYLAPEIVLNDGHDWSVDYWAFGVFLFEMTSGKEPFRSKNPMEVYKQIVSGHVDIPHKYFSANLADLIKKLLNISKSKRLGRTLGGGGAVMQHRWYDGFDWDAHLEKRLKAPLQPKTDSVLQKESTGTEPSKLTGSESAQKTKASRAPTSQSSIPPKHRSTKTRISYSLGQGNRHHQKLLDIIGQDSREDRQNDAVRMSTLRVIKQNERWSKTSYVSEGNDSTRNTSLGVSVDSSSYIEDESSVSSGGRFGDVMQLINLSLPSKRDSKEPRKQAFQQFTLLGIDQISFEGTDICDRGTKYLDPFSTKNVVSIDQFPSSLNSSIIDSEALAAFCFSNGLSLRLIPRSAAVGAKRLGWLGPDGDHYQLQGFTDVHGSLSHGVAITIFEELTGSHAQKICRFLDLHRHRRRARVVISRWLNAKLSDFRRAISTRTLSTRLASSSKRTSTASLEKRSNSMNVSIREAMERMISKTGMSSREMSSSHSGSTDFEIDETTFEITEPAPVYSSPISKDARRLGREAYQAMIDVEDDGDICIVEKSYVITGTSLQDQSLIFCGLQNLINMERLMKDRDELLSRRRSLLCNEDANLPREDTKHVVIAQKRHAVLAAFQTSLMLDPSQKRVSYPRSELAHIQTPHRRFVMDLSLRGFDAISLPLPLPLISSEWGVSRLLLGIKDSGVMILLKLLLLERSILVVGLRTEEVTSCATALLELLNPYKWASAFMPLLPREMLDFVSSPVPFIAGTIVENSKRVQDIVRDTSVREAMSNGLSIVNLVTGKLIVTREKGTSEMLRRSFIPIPELQLYQKRLEEYSRRPSSNLHSFQSFFMHGASRKESLTLCKIRGVIKNHLSQYTAGLNARSDAWQQYGEFNEAFGTFDFCPDKFIQPLKDRMIFQIQFQEIMAHTQLFVGYVEDIKNAHDKRNKDLMGPSAQVIVRSIETHWCDKHSSK